MERQFIDGEWVDTAPLTEADLADIPPPTDADYIPELNEASDRTFDEREIKAADGYSEARHAVGAGAAEAAKNSVYLADRAGDPQAHGRKAWQ